MLAQCFVMYDKYADTHHHIYTNTRNTRVSKDTWNTFEKS